MTLWSLFQNNNGNIIHKWKHYFPIYEKHFNRFINGNVNFLEIGVFKGGSLNMWKDYFGPGAQIVGIDIDPECKKFENDQIQVRIGDQKDKKFLQSLVQEFGEFDVVLDDGSHVMSDVVASFNYLFPNLSKTGCYFVEDMHTAYWKEYEGGLRRPESFIEFAKSLVDDMNSDWIEEEFKANIFGNNINSISFYDSCVVIEKGRNLKKSAPKIGKGL
jgi:SAM-dependent methyltransferase